MQLSVLHNAERLLQQAYKHGIRIPEELPIYGFSGMQLASYAALPLSTIVQDFEGMGEKGAEMLIQLLENKSENKKIDRDKEDEIEANNDVDDYRKAGVSAFLFGLSNYCVGYNTYDLESIKNIGENWIL